MARTRYIGLALLAASTALASPSVAKDKRIILGVGIKDCAAYTHVQVTKPDEAGLSLQINYILGYLAAATKYEEGDVLHGAKTNDVLHWFELYCAAHPEDSLTRALDRFVETEGGRK